MPSLTTATDLRTGGPGRLAVVGGGVLVCVIALLAYVVLIQTPTPKSSKAEQAVQAPAGNGAAAPLTPPARSSPVETARVDDKPVAGGASPAATHPGSEDSPRRIAVQAPPGAGRSASPASRGEALSQSAVPATTAAAPADAAPPQPSTVSPAASAAAPVPAEIQSRPPSLKDALTKMTLNILVYDEAEAARRVVINGKKYVKGDFVDGHYLIEDITIEGAVLSYEGERAILRPR